MKKLNSLIQGIGLLTLIAGLVGACSLFQSIKPTPETQSQNDSTIDRSIASEEMQIPALTLAQIEELDSKTVFEFYTHIHQILGALEKFQENSINNDFTSKNTKVQLLQWIEESHASENSSSYTPGSQCISSSGYWGVWRRSSTGKGNFRITCDTPNRCHSATDRKGQKTGRECNPKFYTYANADTGEAYCASPNQNCEKVISLFSKEMGPDAFKKHFHQNLKTLIRKDPKYSKVPKERAERLYTDEVIFAEFNRIRSYCGNTMAELNRHSTDQKNACLDLVARYKALKKLTAKVDYDNPKLRRPTRTSPLIASLGGLGPYSCLKQGLARAGYPNVSNKYIAAIALAAKYNQDAFMNIPEEGRQITMKTSIMTLASLGTCDSSQYEFSLEEAGAADNYLSQPKFSEKSDYESLFQTKIGKMTFDQWSTPTIKRRDFNFWNKGTPLQQCVVPAPQQTQVLCEEMSQACGVDTTGCGLDVHESTQPRDGRSSHQPPYNGQPDAPQYDQESPNNAERHY